MPAKHPPPVGTLAFLAECGRTVYVVCNHCNRFVVAKLQEIAQHVGWRTNVQEAGKRLRCKECNHVGAKITIERPQVGQRVSALSATIQLIMTRPVREPQDRGRIGIRNAWGGLSGTSIVTRVEHRRCSLTYVAPSSERAGSASEETAMDSSS